MAQYVNMHDTAAGLKLELFPGPDPGYAPEMYVNPLDIISSGQESQYSLPGSISNAGEQFGNSESEPQGTFPQQTSDTQQATQAPHYGDYGFLQSSDLQDEHMCNIHPQLLSPIAHENAVPQGFGLDANPLHPVSYSHEPSNSPYGQPGNEKDTQASKYTESAPYGDLFPGQIGAQFGGLQLVATFAQAIPKTDSADPVSQQQDTWLYPQGGVLRSADGTDRHADSSRREYGGPFAMQGSALVDTSQQHPSDFFSDCQNVHSTNGLLSATISPANPHPSSTPLYTTEGSAAHSPYWPQRQQEVAAVPTTRYTISTFLTGHERQ